MADKLWIGNGTASSGNYGDWSQADNWSPSGVPVASDNVRFSAEHTQAVTAGLNQSSITLGDLIIEDGYSGKIGTNTAPLQIGVTTFEYAGRGDSAFLDIAASSVNPVIHNTGSSTTGKVGLHIKGSAMGTVVVMAGSVGLGSLHGTSATVTTLRVTGGSVEIGSGSTVTNIYSFGGSVTTRTNITDCNVNGGTVTAREQAAITTLDLEDGTVNFNSEATWATVNVNGGRLSIGAGSNKTITNLTLEPGGELIYYPSNLTLSNDLPKATQPIRITTSDV